MDEDDITEDLSAFITVHVPIGPTRETVLEPLTGHQDLEELLGNIYQKKLVFPYQHKEVRFIQTAIETLVLAIVTDILDNKEDIFDLRNEAHEDLETNTDAILCKIGSFYEQTKNTYPDQFDFVYVPFTTTVTHTISHRKWVALEPNHARIQEIVESLLNRGRLTYKDDVIGDIEFVSFVQQTGDISTFRFHLNRNERYKRDLETTKIIHVDLVPGIRIIDPNLTENVRSFCPVQGFQGHILESASMQYLRLQYSPAVFCDAEVDFMQRVLSRRHLKVYRILKYLINGRDDDLDLLDECVLIGGKSDFFIPSYAIKTSIVIHHYECADESDNVGHCILGILQWFQGKFAEPAVVQRRGGGCTCQVQITDITNQKLILATGSSRLIMDAKRCLDTITRDLLTYYKKAQGHDTGVYSFAARMSERVKKYDLDQRPVVRVVRHGGRAMAESGSCCYKLIILTCVVLFALGLLSAIIARRH